MKLFSLSRYSRLSIATSKTLARFFALFGGLSASALASDKPSDYLLPSPTLYSLAINGPSLEVIASQPFAHEPTTDSAAIPGKFSILRRGSAADLAQSITLYLEYWGTADGNDYEPLPRQITMPGGVRELSFLVQPTADHLGEGIETVEARIVPPLPVSTAGATPVSYTGAYSFAQVQIGDADVPPDYPVIKIISIVPETSEPLVNSTSGNSAPNGLVQILRTHEEIPVTIHLAYSGSATARDYSALPKDIFFPAGINSTTLTIHALADQITDDNESVIVRVLPWQSDPANPGDQPYLVDPFLCSATISIADTPAPPPPPPNQQPIPPTLSIWAIAPETTEPGPNVKVQPAILTLRRSTGNGTLYISLIPSGTATQGKDYAAIPVVIMQNGVLETQIEVSALADSLKEPDETVVVTIPVSPFRSYLVDPDHASAAVIIHDAVTVSLATLQITSPPDGSELHTSVFDLKAIAQEPDSVIERVEFFDGDQSIGVSQLATGALPAGARLEHTLHWANIPVGKHLVTARALDSKGFPIISQTVSFTSLIPSAAKLLQIRSATSTELLLHLTAPAARTYSIQSSSNLVDWIDRQTIDLPEGEVNLSTPTDARASREFFRVQEQ